MVTLDIVCLVQFCLNKQKSSIHQGLKWYLAYLYFKDQIFMFLTWKIWFSMLELKILGSKILIEYPEHILHNPWSISIFFWVNPIHFSVSQNSSYNWNYLFFISIFISLLLLLSYLDHIIYGAVQDIMGPKISVPVLYLSIIYII